MRCGRGASTTRRSLRRVSCERAAAVSVIAPVGLGVPQNRQGQYWLLRYLKRLDCRYLLALEVFHHIELIRGLQVQPKLRCRAEVAGKPRTGSYVEGTDQPAGSEISVDDFAVALVDEAEKDAHRGRRWTIANA